MPQTKQTSWNLPQDPKYHDWSKALLQAQIGQDPQLDPYLVCNADYLINLDTIAIYEFQKEPLLGKYKSVILDAKQGIVLSKRSTCALFTAYGRQCLLGGIEFQRELASKLQLQSQCVIATGKVAFFSMHTYTAGNND